MALFRNWSVVNFAQIGEGRLSWGLFSKVNLLVAIFSAFSAPHGKSRSPKTDLPTLLNMREQPVFTKSVPDPPTGRTFHMFECMCGNRTWISEKT
jgi:hypothetical protein